MKTTLGQLIADLFAEYQHRYHDEELAAVATQVMLNDLMRSSRLVDAPRTPVLPR